MQCYLVITMCSALIFASLRLTGCASHQQLFVSAFMHNIVYIIPVLYIYIYIYMYVQYWNTNIHTYMYVCL